MSNKLPRFNLRRSHYKVRLARVAHLVKDSKIRYRKLTGLPHGGEPVHVFTTFTGECLVRGSDWRIDRAFIRWLHGLEWLLARMEEVKSKEKTNPDLIENNHIHIIRDMMPMVKGTNVPVLGQGKVTRRIGYSGSWSVGIPQIYVNRLLKAGIVKTTGERT